VAGDATALTRLFAPDFRLVNPTGTISTAEQLLKLLTGGAHPYASARYTTELVREMGDVVVTVGMEEVVPNQGPQAGQLVHRRVTQVWKREQGHWLLTLRHAAVVPEPAR
jgi:ketosteroid isomerase-like protein